MDRFNALGRGLQLMLVGSVLLLIDTFLNWQSIDTPIGSFGQSAWHGFGGVLKTVFGNPGYTTTVLLERDKMLYLLQVVAPLAFFPWRRPIGILCTVPGFVFTLLGTRYPALTPARATVFTR